MSVARYQIAINSEDPVVVAQGLKELGAKILSDHRVQDDSFGDCGIPRYNGNDILHMLCPEPPEDIVGILKLYLASSPLLEEFFTLWDQPNREFDSTLCMEHMKCLFIILHCSRSNKAFVNRLVHRIISEYNASIIKQLQSTDAKLFLSTLVLINECIRISRMVPSEVISAGIERLSSAIANKTFLDDSDDLEAYSKFFVAAVCFIFLCVKELDLSLSLPIVTNNVLISGLFNHINSLPEYAVTFVLSSVVHIVQLNPNAQEHVDTFINKQMLNKVIQASLSTSDATKKLAIDNFLTSLGSLFADFSENRNKSNFTGRSINNIVNMLIDSLQPLPEEEQLSVQITSIYLYILTMR